MNVNIWKLFYFKSEELKQLKVIFIFNERNRITPLPRSPHPTRASPPPRREGPRHCFFSIYLTFWKVGGARRRTIQCPNLRRHRTRGPGGQEKSDRVAGDTKELTMNSKVIAVYLKAPGWKGETTWMRNCFEQPRGVHKVASPVAQKLDFWRRHEAWAIITNRSNHLNHYDNHPNHPDPS